MNLIVDAGNTLVKLAVFEEGRSMYDQYIDAEHAARQIKEVCDHYPNITHSIVASVGNLDKKIIAILSIFSEVHELNHGSRVPFKNLYATPHTLGVDRIALATAAFYRNNGGNTLVVDAGTCITYDFLNDRNEYLGGGISPGVQMRYKALHGQTAKLPLLEASSAVELIGNTTEESIHSGVVNGICHEMDGVIDQYKTHFKDLTVILTGGDAQFLSNRLKNTIFAHSNFLLLGLNYLLEYNKK